MDSFCNRICTYFSLYFVVDYLSRRKTAWFKNERGVDMIANILIGAAIFATAHGLCLSAGRCDRYMRHFSLKPASFQPLPWLSHDTPE